MDGEVVTANHQQQAEQAVDVPPVENEEQLAEKRSFLARLNVFGKKKKKKDDGENENKDDSKKYPPVSFIGLFRYATRAEKVQMAIACVCATLHGAALPLFTIVFGQVRFCCFFFSVCCTVFHEVRREGIALVSY